MGPHPMESHARREMSEDTVVRSSTRLQTKTIIAVIRSLGLDAHSSDDGVRPGFPFAGAPGDFGASAVTEVFHVLVQINRRREGSDDAALDSKPLVCAIGDGRISVHARSVEYRGEEPQH